MYRVKCWCLHHNIVTIDSTSQVAHSVRVNSMNGKQMGQIWTIRPKLCGNCAFSQNFYTKKLGEITVFFAVLYVYIQRKKRNESHNVTHSFPRFKPCLFLFWQGHLCKNHVKEISQILHKKLWWFGKRYHYVA